MSIHMGTSKDLILLQGAVTEEGPDHEKQQDAAPGYLGH